MARIRSLHPTFARSPSMRRVSRDARLLFVQLWTIVDDQGRTPAEPDDLAAVLYPSDLDAERYMQLWLDEFEAEGCIERYDVEGIDYLRVIHWHKHQQISHPTQSRLPPSPNEWPPDSGIPEFRKLPECVGAGRGKRRNIRRLRTGPVRFRNLPEKKSRTTALSSSIARPSCATCAASRGVPKRPPLIRVPCARSSCGEDRRGDCSVGAEQGPGLG